MVDMTNDRSYLGVDSIQRMVYQYINYVILFLTILDTPSPSPRLHYRKSCTFCCRKLFLFLTEISRSLMDDLYNGNRWEGVG